MSKNSCPGVYDFDDRLAMSEGIDESCDIRKILLENIPGAMEVIKAHFLDDKSGTDYWVVLENGERISVDKKVREEDWAIKEPRPQDDLALETWSNVERKKVGWSRDPHKITDYIIWLWMDTRRWCLIPFRMLCAVFEENWERWFRLYKTSRQTTPVGNGATYQSECIFVPRKVVWSEIYRKYSGDPKSLGGRA